MTTLEDLVDATALAEGFTGVVRVDRSGRTEVAKAYGYADRAHRLANAVTTQFGTASATKGLTALTVMALVEQGHLRLSTTARSLLGDDLPEIADDVTVEHLLGHRSGIGDYLGEHDLDATQHVLQIPVHRLDNPEHYLPVLAGHPTAYPADEGFAYNNAGYVVLALLLERAGGCRLPRAGTPLRPRARRHDGHRVPALRRAPRRCRPWAPRPRGLRTTVLHLPVVGVGDGGAYSTAADLHSFWRALHSGRIVSPGTVAQMVTPRSDWPAGSRPYGWGFHLHATGGAAWPEGYDAGVSFTSLHDLGRELTYTVISNWTDGAWPVVALLNDRLGL